jgi:ribonucleoside-diphosphate reductase alpha chain
VGDDPETDQVKGVERQLWEKIRRTCVQGRRTGIGITAEGDMLAALGLRYGSEEAIQFSEKVHQTLALAAYRGSVALARERGAFPVYDTELEKNNPFINRLSEAEPDLYKDMVQYGRRNIALLTIAPTGTTSLMTQTSSGIEPAFMISYTRRRKVNPNDKDVKVSFVDKMGDAWEEFRVFHHKFVDWLKANDHDLEKVKNLPEEKLADLIAQSPFHRATANDIDWVQKVKMQGAIQKWVDHSISVTVNLPGEVTVETVKDIYQTAWKVGCKGCTIYRDGSRSGVLIANKKEEEEPTAFQETMPPKRPQRLEAAIVRFQNKKEQWIAVIGLYEGKPYEIFTGRAEDMFRLPDYVATGWVLKTKNGEGQNRYDFQFLDKDGYRITIEGLSRSFNKEYWNYAKMISGVLRHGMPIVHIVDMLQSLHVKEEYINNWMNGVARALKKFIPAGTKAPHSACPECKDPDGLMYEEGCLLCHSCGYTECG